MKRCFISRSLHNIVAVVYTAKTWNRMCRRGFQSKTFKVSTAKKPVVVCELK